MSIQIKDSVALVTGSNRGIGRAFVEALLERGAAKVYAAARRPETLADLAAAHPGRVVPLALDVTDPSQVAAAADRAGDANLVINNAGYLGQPDLFAADLAGARAEFEVNYWGPLHITRAFAPILKRNGGGALAFVNSVAGLSGFPPIPTYSDSKAASHSLTTVARFLLGDQETQVTGIYPGPIDTDMAKDVPMDKASPASAVERALDDLERGETESFPDPFSAGFADDFAAGHKQIERRIAEMLQPAEA